MGYQKAPLRARGITTTLPALLWSGKQRHVNQPSLAGISGGVLALVHLPCYAPAEAGVILPPTSFCSFEKTFFSGSFDHYAAHFPSDMWHWGVVPCMCMKTTLRAESQLIGNGQVSKWDVCFLYNLVVLCSRAGPFVGAVALSCWWIDWPRGSCSHFNTSKRLQCILLVNLLSVMLQNLTHHLGNQFVHNRKCADV